MVLIIYIKNAIINVAKGDGKTGISQKGIKTASVGLNAITPTQNLLGGLV